MSTPLFWHTFAYHRSKEMFCWHHHFGRHVLLRRRRCISFREREWFLVVLVKEAPTLLRAFSSSFACMPSRGVCVRQSDTLESRMKPRESARRLIHSSKLRGAEWRKKEGGSAIHQQCPRISKYYELFITSVLHSCFYSRQHPCQVGWTPQAFEISIFQFDRYRKHQEDCNIL